MTRGFEASPNKSKQNTLPMVSRSKNYRKHYNYCMQLSNSDTKRSTSYFKTLLLSSSVSLSNYLIIYNKKKTPASGVCNGLFKTEPIQKYSRKLI